MIHLRPVPKLHPFARIRIADRKRDEIHAQLRKELQYDRAENNRQRRRRSELYYTR